MEAQTREAWDEATKFHARAFPRLRVLFGLTKFVLASERFSQIHQAERQRKQE